MKGLIFTYVMAYGGAAVALFNPFVGLLIYVSFAIIRPRALWHWSVPQGNYSEVVAIALLLGWAARGFGNWRFGREGVVVGAFAGFWGWAVVSAFLAPEPEVAWGFVAAMAKIFLPFLVGVTLIDSVAKLKALAWVMVLSQGYVALELNLYYLRGFNRVWEDGFGAMDNNCVAIGMVTGIGLAFFLGLAARRWWAMALAFAAAALMTHTVCFSYSRGGMLALLVTGALAFLLLPKQPKHYLAFGLGLLLAFEMAGPSVRNRFFSTFADSAERDRSAQSRLELWSDAWDATLRRPVFGLGPDHWPLVAAEYGWAPGKEAHSLWLQTGAELGLPGLALLALFYGSCVAMLWPLARGRDLALTQPWVREWACMAVAALTGFAVSAQFVSLEGLELPYYTALLGACVLKLAAAEAVAAAPARRRVSAVVRLPMVRPVAGGG